jgi:glycine/serine hydroxymethyltransferase
MVVIVDLIDKVLSNIDNPVIVEDVKNKVKDMMSGRPLYAW